MDVLRLSIVVATRQRSLTPRLRARSAANYQLSWISEIDENGPTLGELGPNPLEFRATLEGFTIATAPIASS